MSKAILSAVIDRATGQTALALKLKALRPNSKIRQGHINNWLNRDGGKVPPEWIIPVCQVDGWVATPHQLDAELYPYPQDGLPEHLRNAA